VSKFTPGTYYAAGMQVCVDTPKGRAELATVCDTSEYVRKVEADANLRLFVAAPELLAACQKVVAEWSGIYELRHSPTIRAARAAIAKATGDKP